jgi:hypothetical protein
MKQQGAIVTGNKRSFPAAPVSDRTNKFSNSVEE